MAKHIIKISILLVWVGLMGWWWLESRTWPVPEKINAAFLPDYNDYYGLSFGEQKIGWANKSLRRNPEGGYQGIQSMTVKLALEDQVVDINFSVTADFDRVLNLTEFRYMIQAGPVVVAETGEVTQPQTDCPEQSLEGAELGAEAAGVQTPSTDSEPCQAELSDNSEAFLKVEVNLGEFDQIFKDLLTQHRDLLGDYAERLDFSRPVELAVPDGPGLPQFIPSYLSYLGLTRGANYNLIVLDPANRVLTPLNVRVEDKSREYDKETGRDIDVYRIRLTSASGGGLLWLDRYGRTVREETLGFKLERVVSLASKYEEPALAAQGVVPLKPPPGLQRLFTGGGMDKLLDRVRPEPQPGRNEEKTKPELPDQPENQNLESDGGTHD